MKSTRETRKSQMDSYQGRKAPAGKGENAARPQRAAFGDLTNAVKSNAGDNAKKDALLGKKGRQPTTTKAPAPTKTRTAQAQAVPAPIQTKTRKAASATATATTTSTTTTRSLAAKAAVAGKAVKKDVLRCREKMVVKPAPPPVVSEEAEATSSHDLSEMVVSDLELSFSDVSVEDRGHSRMSLDRSIQESCTSNKEVMPEVPEGVEDIDSADVDDVTQVALYAQDVFNYYREREELFRLTPYMVRQPQVTQRMRAVLVDWMVEVQENFELNHETLYLAVKLVDSYLGLTAEQPRDMVQLLGAVALFLASKYDERMPPAIDDFIYICDNAYDRDQFMEMERELFRTVDYDLGRPIAYRYLRRYSKCGRSETKTLYLARYLLELGLMEYKFVFQSESMLAASVLYIAKKMRNDGDWTPTLEFYTGHTLAQMKPLILEINHQFTNQRFPQLHTVRDKYKHQVFLKVAEVPPVSNEVLFPGIGEEYPDSSSEEEEEEEEGDAH